MIVDEISMVRTGLDAESSTRLSSALLDEDKLEIKGSYSTKVQPVDVPCLCPPVQLACLGVGSHQHHGYTLSAFGVSRRVPLPAAFQSIQGR